jgi:hypothetical protein
VFSGIAMARNPIPWHALSKLPSGPATLTCTGMCDDPLGDQSLRQLFARINNFLIPGWRAPIFPLTS